jgi:transcriptional regulator with XRE-family HTH domain
MAPRFVRFHEPIPPLTLGELLIRRRQELGLTRDELAQLLGPRWTAADVRRLETSQTIMPSWIRLQILSSALGLPIDTLLSGVFEPEPPQM